MTAYHGGIRFTPEVYIPVNADANETVVALNPAEIIDLTGKNLLRNSLMCEALYQSETYPAISSSHATRQNDDFNSWHFVGDGSAGQIQIAYAAKQSGTEYAKYKFILDNIYENMTSLLSAEIKTNVNITVQYRLSATSPDSGYKAFTAIGRNITLNLNASDEYQKITLKGFIPENYKELYNHVKTFRLYMYIAIPAGNAADIHIKNMQWSYGEELPTFDYSDYDKEYAINALKG